MPSRSAALLGMQPRGTPDQHHIERRMAEEIVQLFVGGSATTLRERYSLSLVLPMDSGNLDTGDAECRTRVRLADVACAEDADAVRNGPNAGQPTVRRARH